MSIPVLAKNTENSGIVFDKEILKENIISNMDILKKLVNDNMPPQSGPNKKLSRAQIENIALRLFIYYRKHAALCTPFTPLEEVYVYGGNIVFTTKEGIFNVTREHYTELNIDKDGNFSFLLGGKGESLCNGGMKARNCGRIDGIRRDDGYYDIHLINTWVDSRYYHKCVKTSICDLKGNIINQERIKQK